LLPSKTYDLNNVEPDWRCMLSKADSRVPISWRNWLADAGSLTERLMQASDGNLRVSVLKQGFEVPRFSERQLLGLADRRRAMVREVVLYGNAQPWVFARSILPLTTLTGRLRKLRQLSNQPLGELLFKDPTMCREPVQVAYFDAGNRLLPPSVSSIDQASWGRRSVFRLDKKPLLVAEVFLPDFHPYHLA
jgi:chorismate--pyruvate lyase